MTDSPNSLGDERTQAGLPPEPSIARSLGDQSTQAEGVSSVSDLGALAANLDETLELTDLAARYEIGEVIGRGGMGEVLKARDKRLERPVAIKRILGEGARSATALRRFLTEARSLARLNHFNVVQVYDYGRDREGPFLILEYVAGKSLQDRLKAGPLPLEQAVDLTCQLCDGLGAAHKQGIIHRDVKPANVLLTEEGEPKLTDFGLAHRETNDDGRTQAGAVLGTIDFMPPEQRRDATQADARSDLWSLAATLYQMLTGKIPKVIRLDLVPDALRSALGKALEEEPAQRYGSTVEFKTALRNALRQGMVASSVLGEGACAQCGTQNDPGRKFCRSCASALSSDCLCCGEETPVWDDVCGRCGTRQSVRLTELRSHCETRLEESATFGREYRFDEALALCQAVVQEKQPALADLRERGTSLATELTRSRDEQLRLRAVTLNDAQAYWSASQYETVLKELEKIPEPLCDAKIQELRSNARNRIIELTSLLTEIKRRIASKALDDLENLTARVLEIQPNHAQVAELHLQLIGRAEKRRQKYDAIQAQAEEAYENQEDQRALAILGRLPASERRDALRAAASDRLQRVQQLRELLGKMPAGVARIAPLRDYLKLRPRDEDARRMLLKLEHLAPSSFVPWRRSALLIVIGGALLLVLGIAWTVWRSDKLKESREPLAEASPVRPIESSPRSSNENAVEPAISDRAPKTQPANSTNFTVGNTAIPVSSPSFTSPSSPTYISPSGTAAPATSPTTVQSAVNTVKTIPDSSSTDRSANMKSPNASLQSVTNLAPPANAPVPAGNVAANGTATSTTVRKPSVLAAPSSTVTRTASRPTANPDVGSPKPVAIGRLVNKSFEFTDQKEIQKSWEIKGRSRLEGGGIRLYGGDGGKKPGEPGGVSLLQSKDEFVGDLIIGIAYQMSPNCEMWLDLWGERFELKATGNAGALITRNGNLVTVQNGRLPVQTIQLTKPVAARSSSLRLYLDRRNLYRSRMELLVMGISVKGKTAP